MCSLVAKRRCWDMHGILFGASRWLLAGLIRIPLDSISSDQSRHIDIFWGGGSGGYDRGSFSFNVLIDFFGRGVWGWLYIYPVQTEKKGWIVISFFSTQNKSKPHTCLKGAMSIYRVPDKPFTRVVQKCSATLRSTSLTTELDLGEEWGSTFLCRLKSSLYKKNTQLQDFYFWGPWRAMPLGLRAQLLVCFFAPSFRCGLATRRSRPLQVLAMLTPRVLSVRRTWSADWKRSEGLRDLKPLNLRTVTKLTMGLAGWIPHMLIHT